MRFLLLVTLLLAGWVAATGPSSAETPSVAKPRYVEVPMTDGVKIAVAVYLPANPGRYPALLATSPYRIDNDDAPAVPAFPFRESGPIDLYLANGYAFVRMDVRGTGRSGGEYLYFDKREQRDLREVIEWISRQSWASGKVGGIGQSYYARSQWFMAAEAPPALACIAPYDGNTDAYRASAYNGGIPGAYLSFWYNYLRNLNIAPLTGTPRDLPFDFTNEVLRHPTYDAFWRERSSTERLEQIKIPVFSIGVWGKVDLHLNGNIVGYQRAGGPKKLLVLGGSGIDAAVAEFANPAFHERHLIPFYDWCLKGKATSYTSEPAVRYAVVNDEGFRTASSWPPAEAKPVVWHLAPGPSGSIRSLNDGLLTATPPTTANAGSRLDFPQSSWSNSGPARMGPQGRLDTASRVLTFTTPPLADDMVIAGPAQLRLNITSSRNDADFIVKLYEQMPQTAGELAGNKQPQSELVSKGWLRASHRAVDTAVSLPNAPWYRHDKPELLVPGQPYSIDVALVPIAARIAKGRRLRIEVSNMDSPLTDGIFTHTYRPDQVGSYTILHDPKFASRLTLLAIP